MAQAMILCLIRHAKSDWSTAGLPDFERPLNKRGYADAPVMGKRLNDRGIKPDLIISSTAVRAYSTAAILAREAGLPENRITLRADLYESDCDTYLKVLAEEAKGAGTVFLIGHNPVITELANMLGGLETDNIPTAGIACFETSDNPATLRQGKGKLLFFDYPKKDA